MDLTAYVVLVVTVVFLGFSVVRGALPQYGSATKAKRTVKAGHGNQGDRKRKAA